MLGDEALAEDVAAETFIRTLVRWAKVRDLPHRDAWILRVATNLCIDHLRRRRRDRRLLEQAAPPPHADLDPALRLDLVRALAALPKRQREVVVLRHVAGLGEAEVADAMGVSINTVKTHGARALAQLRAGALHDLEGGFDAI
jgi:RNA polymerase sigma factor (sigma-70 family)